MKGLITAGGRGTRLRPLTHTNNKHLIPIANKPMIFYAIEAMVEAGIRKIGVIVNPETAGEIKAALSDGSAWGARIDYIEQDSPQGLAHAVKVSRGFIGNEPFVFYLGDNVVVGGIRRFRKEFERNRSACHLVLARVRDPERFGVPEIVNGRIVGVAEKPKRPKSPFAVTGIYFYTSKIFDAVNAISPSARGELEISDAHDYLIRKGKRVSYSEITGWWKDTGKADDLLEANRLVLDQIIERRETLGNGQVDAQSDIAGKVIIEPGAKVRASQIRGPVIIGKDALIEESYIGPFTSVGPECVVKNSEVEYSVLLERCRIIDAEARIERSLLGREVEIVKVKNRPRTQRFIVADQSRIELS